MFLIHKRMVDLFKRRTTQYGQTPQQILAKCLNKNWPNASIEEKYAYVRRDGVLVVPVDMLRD